MTTPPMNTNPDEATNPDEVLKELKRLRNSYDTVQLHDEARIFDRAIACINDLRAMADRPRFGTWIAVKDRLPTKEDANFSNGVLALSPAGNSIVCAYWCIEPMTHWMPLPPPLVTAPVKSLAELDAEKIREFVSYRIPTRQDLMDLLAWERARVAKEQTK